MHTTPITTTTHDRCDRCGALAHVLVILATGAELSFCLHHARKYQSRLTAIGARIIDESLIEA